LIQPYFLLPKPEGREPIAGFEGVYRWGYDSIHSKIESDLEAGVRAFLFFGVSDVKDAQGSPGWQEESAIPMGLQRAKRHFGDAAVFFADVCLCPFTDHGHCGVLRENRVDNDATLDRLSKIALVYAQAGADFIAPSDMMDGRIGAIRRSLDEGGFSSTGILAYTAKYASSYYGPFRNALDSSPQQGDRSAYQMDFRRKAEALRELALDCEEGADLVMVKPALAYLDIIADFRRESTVPVVAYSVSGEYQMTKQMAAAGLADGRKLMLENLYAIRRAGAHSIITYAASEIAQKGWLR
jgi:porphobilinogen synthase